MKGKVRIKVKGQLDETWQDWLEGLEFFYEENNTMLAGEIKDEAHIHGMLNKIRDLNLRLISANAFNDEYSQENNNDKNKKPKS